MQEYACHRFRMTSSSPDYNQSFLALEEMALFSAIDPGDVRKLGGKLRET